MPLPVATEGCCKGHPCDNCKTCQGGRCCRRDNPDYKLPKLGEWDGPIYGELGVLNHDGDKVECHFCGGWYVRVAMHAWRIHDLTAAEYKAIIGMRKKGGLYAPAKREEWSQTHQHIKDYGGNPIVSKATPEQRAAWARIPRRLQARFDPEYKPMRQERGRKAGSATAAKMKERTHCKNGHELTPENVRVYGTLRLCRLCRKAIKQRYNEKSRLNSAGETQ